MLHNLPEDGSGSEISADDSNNVCTSGSDVDVETSSSDGSLDEMGDTAPSEAVSVPATDTGECTSKYGTKWQVVSLGAKAGRLEVHNVFTAKPGPTAYARPISTPVDAFKLLLDVGMLRHSLRNSVIRHGMSWGQVGSIRQFAVFERVYEREEFSPSPTMVQRVWL